MKSNTNNKMMVELNTFLGLNKNRYEILYTITYTQYIIDSHNPFTKQKLVLSTSSNKVTSNIIITSLNILELYININSGYMYRIQGIKYIY